MKVDLHIHSNLSDGKYSPSQIVEYAVRNKLDIIALTDHDTIDGLQEAKAALRRFVSLKLITGVEFSTSLGDDELHILGYGVDETHPRLVHLLKLAQQNRKTRLGNILHKLAGAGIRLNMGDVQNGDKSVSLGRIHVARALINRGYVRTIKEAFERYLSYDASILEPTTCDLISSHQAMEVILEAGGIPVFAHPTIELFDRHIDRLIQSHLQGVEVFKNTRTSIEEYYLETVVKDKGLFLTGGSDWHGYRANRRLGSFYVDSERIHAFLEAVRLF
jgi:3',5'-nucleoside bisphosphate phosphatase